MPWEAGGAQARLGAAPGAWLSIAGMNDPQTARVDAFTDAAFAFAATLLVIGSGGDAVDSRAMIQAVSAIPSFLIGFAIIVMFWLAHVEWRRLRGPGDWRSTFFTLLLIFVTLVYVVPLRGMATSFAAYLRGVPDAFAGRLGTLFAIYGLGFSAMSIITAMLFRDALRNPALSLGERRTALGQVWIWSILAWTGAASMILSMLPPLRLAAPWAYATLPVTVGLFAWFWDWEGRGPAPAASVGDSGSGAGDAARQPVLAPDDVQPAADDQRGPGPGGQAGQGVERDISEQSRPQQP